MQESRSVPVVDEMIITVTVQSELVDDSLRQTAQTADAAVLVILVLCIPLWDGVLPAAFAAAVAHILRTVHRIKQTYLQLYAREYFAFAEKKQDPPPACIRSI